MIHLEAAAPFADAAFAQNQNLFSAPERIDALCNVAGVPSDGHIEDVTEDELDRVVAINLKGVVFGCQAALRVMKPR